MAALKLWEPTPRFDDLILRNAASVVGYYLDEGVDPAIFSGGIFTQEHLNRFIDLLSRSVDIQYFWLEVPDIIRAKRLIARGRDSGDSPESVEILVPKYAFEPKPLAIDTGAYKILNAANQPPQQVVDEIIKSL